MSARVLSARWRAVGTLCSAAVTCSDGDRRRARAALDAAQAEVAACERELSRFDPASDLSRLNAAGGGWVTVGPRLLETLRLALNGRARTGGRFDPTVLPALQAAGYDRSFEKIVERPARRPAGWRAGAAVHLDLAAGRARLEPGAGVDLGGIGKGYAATRALGAMAEAWPGLPGALVDLGGDLAVHGEAPGRSPWRIRIEDPRRPGATLGVLALREGGVATSGRDIRRFGPGRALHHLIDPATGSPAEPGPLTVTVVASDAAEAEVFATTLAISDPATATVLIDDRPHLSALYVPGEGPPLALGSLPLARTRVLVRAAA